MPSKQFSQQTLELLIRQRQAKYPGRSRAAIIADLDQGAAAIRDLAAQGYTLEELLAFIGDAIDES